MQPSEPVVESKPAVATDTVSDETRSTEAQESSSQPSAWHRFFGAVTGRTKTETPKAEADAAPPPEPPVSTVTLTQDEFDRRVQAETDRREAKRQREATEKTERERREAIERKLDPASSEYDPHGGAEERAQLKAAEEASQHFSGLLQDISKQHDAVTLDVIKELVPDKEWDRIVGLEGAGVGLDGRRLIVTEGLKALEKHWKAEGARETETKLRSDPVFRKRVFAEHRGDVEEPELVPGAASRGNNDFMDMIRTDYETAKRRR